MSVKLGEAVVYLLGDKEGIEDSLQDTEKKTTSWAQGLGGKIQGFLGGALKVGVAGAAAAIVGIGAAAFSAGMQMDEAMDTIAISTGATGEALEGLGDDFKAVFTSIPTEAGPASEVISELNKRLGLTGESLQETAKPLLEMTRLLGGDAKNNTALFTRVMGDWSIKNEDAGITLDKVFKASQMTGVGVESLMQKVVSFGSPLRLMGFTLDESIAMFGKWEKEGVNAELVMGSLKIAAAKFADAGVPLQQGLQETITKIKGMDDASAALALGMDVFGARAGPDMVAAIREGRFELGDMVEQLGNAEGAIMSAADATADFPEKFQVFKNVASTVLAPLGIAMMDVATTLLETLGPAIMNVAAAAGPAFETLGTAVSMVFDVLRGTGGDIPWEDILPSWAADVAYQISGAFAGLQQGVSTFMTTLSMGGNIWDALNNGITTFLEGLGVGQPILDAVMDAFYEWGEVLPTVGSSFTTLGSAVQTALGIVMGLVQQLGPIIANIFVTQMQTALSVATTVWGTIGNIISTVVPTIITLLGEIGTRAVPVLVAAFQLIQQIVSDVAAFVVPLVQQFAQLIQEQFATVVSWVQANMPLIQKTLDVVFNGIKVGLGVLLQVWNTVWPVMQVVVTTAFDVIKVAVETVMGVILGIIKIGMQLITGDWEGAWETFKGVIETALGGVLKIVQTVLDDVGTAIGGKVGDFITAGADLVAGLVKGVEDNAGKVLDTMLGMVKNGVDAVKNFFGIKSPSRLMISIGENLMGGLTIGIEGEGANAVAAMKSVVVDLAKMIKDLASAFHQMNKVEKTEGGLPNLQLWADALYQSIILFSRAIAQAAAEVKGKVLNKAIDLTGDLEELFEMMKGFGQLLVSLADIKTIPDLNPVGAALKQAIIVISNAINQAALELGTKAVKGAASLSDEAQRIIGLIQPTVGGLAAMADMPEVEDLRGKSGVLEEALNIFIYTVVRIANFWANVALDAAGMFSGTAQQVIGLIGPGVQQLAAFVDFPEVTDLRAKSGVLETAINIFVYTVLRIANFWASVGLEAAAAFSGNAGQVIGLIGPGVQQLAAFVDFPAVGNLREKAAFLEEAINIFVFYVQRMAAFWANVALGAAAEFAETAGRVIGLIGPGLQTLAAFVDFPEVTNLPAKAAILENAINLFVETIQRIAMQWIEVALTEAAEFSTTVQQVIGLIGPAVDNLTKLEALDKDLDISEEWGALEVAISFIVEQIVLMAAKLGGSAAQAAGEFKTVTVTIAEAVEAGLGTLGKLGGGAATDSVAGVLKAFAESVQGSMQMAVEAVKRGLTDLLNILRPVPGQIQAIFDAFDWGSIGKGIADGIAAGITAGAGAIKTAAKQAAAAALTSAKKELGIASPSERMRDEVGRQAGMGVVLGMEDMIPRIRAAMEQLTSQFNLGGMAPAMAAVQEGNLSVQYIDQRSGGRDADIVAVAEKLEWLRKMRR